MSYRFALPTACACFALVGAIAAELTTQALSIATVVFTLAPIEVRADIPEIDDLLGRWCQNEGASYTFTRTSLEVTFPDNSKRTLQIVKIKPEAADAEIFWSFNKKKDGSDDATGFAISSYKRVLTRQPNGGGDNGPKREFHRC